ncbi:MAG: Protein of unknown function (DUF1016), partial [Candidatus Kentron sp. G]
RKKLLDTFGAQVSSDHERYPADVKCLGFLYLYVGRYPRNNASRNTGEPKNKEESVFHRIRGMKESYDFNALVSSIRQVHKRLTAHAGKAVNISLTVRNWVIGAYIAEYELKGRDRAEYGENLLRNLAARLDDISNCNRRQLYRYLRFYRLYPRIAGTLSPQFKALLPVDHKAIEKVGTLSPQLHLDTERLLR